MKKQVLVLIVALVSCLAQSDTVSAQGKPRIVVFSGPSSTILSSPPLISSNKVRAQQGLPLLTDPDGNALRFDQLVPQRLAAPVEVLIEQFTAHPLEKDAKTLYAPPDGYVDRSGAFHKMRQGQDDKPVYKVILRPEDGLYLLPYMALQSNGQAWDDDCSFRGAPIEKCRQPFYPDASRIFEEIDRSLVGRTPAGTAGSLSGRAEFTFYRAVPPAGYTQGLPEGERTDIGTGNIPPESLGQDFFPYKPYQYAREPLMVNLARATNAVQKMLATDRFAGAIWLEGTPTIQDTIYWLNLLIDTKVPICGNAAQRAHGLISSDGARNIIDSVDYIKSKAWEGQRGDDLGCVLIQDEQIFSARQVEKQDARPGGYRVAGGHGGILGTVGDPGPVTIWFKPTTMHTWKSEVNLTRLPRTVKGVIRIDGKDSAVEVQIKDSEGYLVESAIPKVTVVRYNPWIKDSVKAPPDEEVEVLSRTEDNLRHHALSGFVVEGTAPFGSVQESLAKALEIAAFCGMPVVRVSRGDEGGMVPVNEVDLTIEGNNLTAGKARMLLMAALMKFGSLPVAADPRRPTTDERKQVQERLKLYQRVFNNH